MDAPDRLAATARELIARVDLRQAALPEGGLFSGAEWCLYVRRTDARMALDRMSDAQTALYRATHQLAARLKRMEEEDTP